MNRSLPEQTRPNVPYDPWPRALHSTLLVAVILVLSTAFGAIEWTPTYWKALGLTLAKSVLQAGVAYLMRVYVVPRRSEAI